MSSFADCELQMALRKKDTAELTQKFLHLKLSNNVSALCNQLGLTKRAQGMPEGQTNFYYKARLSSALYPNYKDNIN